MPVKDGARGWKAPCLIAKLLHLIADERVKLIAGGLINEAANTPEERDEEHGLDELRQHRLDLLLFLGVRLGGGVRQQRKEVALEHPQDVCKDGRHRCHDRLCQLQAQKLGAGHDVGVNELCESVTVRVERRRELLQPRLQYRRLGRLVRLQARWQEVRRLDVDHTAAGDRCGRRDGEVLHLEDHAVRLCQRDDLARVQAELLVVVQHRVHVFDPDGVDGSVQQHPLPVGDAVQLLLLRRASVRHGEDAVGPLVCNRVELSVQLPHRDRLWVEHVAAHRLLLGAARFHLCERRSERTVHGRLGAVRVADDHQAVADDDHFVELRDLDEEVLRELEVRAIAVLLAGLPQEAVVRLWQLDAREEVRGDAFKERDVVR
mmetsp:Transcript_13844/g.40760  ORF Transcript_13844/g.40760 Transcript_13844/m.40760 type:complete len:375 (+) Transcript_13844:258-1382(+)